jgi:hypothetical protein
MFAFYTTSLLYKIQKYFVITPYNTKAGDFQGRAGESTNMIAKVFDWVWWKGYDRGYNSALEDVLSRMKDRQLEDLPWELDLLRIP